jgi:hypothetical protein
MATNVAFLATRAQVPGGDVRLTPDQRSRQLAFAQVERKKLQIAHGN